MRALVVLSVFLFYALLHLAFWGTIIYVIGHFVAKFW